MAASGFEAAPALAEQPQWPPPPCPGSDLALWDVLLQTEPTTLHFGEVFAGNAAVSRALLELGYTGRSLDLAFSSFHDVLTPTGLTLLLSTALDLAPA